MRITLKRPVLSGFDKFWIGASVLGGVFGVLNAGVIGLGIWASGFGVGWLMYHLQHRDQWQNVNEMAMAIQDGPAPRSELVVLTVEPASPRES